MASLMNNSSGNFTTAATWSLIESTTFPTSISTQETGTTNTTTSFVSSTSFTGISPTLDGIAVKISTRNANPTGTFSVRLAVAGVAVANTTVTVNVADLPAGISWIFFKFPANVTLSSGTTYTVQLTSSTNNQVTPFRKSATASDWTYALRTTTTQAPASGDQMLVCGEWDSAGVNSSYTVTMDNTASTNFGPAAASTAAIEVSQNGTMSVGTSASTNYVMNLAGSLYINIGGTFNGGTGGTPIPSTSTLKIKFVETANVQFGIEARAGSTLNTGGATKTISAMLAADASAAATSLTTDVSTGWKNGDSIGLASTTRTRTDAETKSLTADASGTTLTISALSNAHSGTSPTQAELINLTRNVQISGTSTTFQAYININATATVDLEYTELFWMGSATTSKRGIDIATTTGSCTINGCALHDFSAASSLGVNFTAGTVNNFTVSNIVMYGIAATAVNQATLTNSNWTLNNIIVMSCTGAQAYNISSLTGTITNINANSCSAIGISVTDATNFTFGTLSGWTAHSNASQGIQFTGVTGESSILDATVPPSVTTLKSWRNNTTAGIQLTSVYNIVLDGITAFGNATGNIVASGNTGNVLINNATIDAGSTFTSPIGISFTSDCDDVYVDNSTFGGTTTHATGDVNIGPNVYARLVFRNCTLNSSTQLAGQANIVPNGFVGMAKLGGIAQNHKLYRQYGTQSLDTTLYNKASPSTRLTPNNAFAKMFNTYKRTAIPSGQTATIGCWIRKSVAGDGSAYNGNQPRIILRKDPSLGINSDTVIATMSAAGGTWQFVSGVTPAVNDNGVVQWYVDCDGTAGWINVDDFTAYS